MLNVLNELLNHFSLTVILDITYTIVCNFFIAFLLLKLNGISLSMIRCIAFGLINSATVCIPNYLVLLVFPQIFPEEFYRPAASLVVFILFFRNPVWVWMCNVTQRRVLRIPKWSVKNTTFMMYCYSLIFSMLSDSMELVYLRVDDIFGIFAFYNIVHIGLIILATTAGLLSGKYITRVMGFSPSFFPVEGEEKKSSWADGYLMVIGIWLILTNARFFLSFHESGVREYFFPVMILLIAVLMIQNFWVKKRNCDIRKLQIRNELLQNSIEEFRGIKHDTNNLLQVYEGFIKTKSYDQLEIFHNELFHVNIEANDKLDFHRFLNSQPAIYGELIALNGYAETNGVSLRVRNISAFSVSALSNMDFCRLLSILTGNAIEHAAQTVQKQVTVTGNPLVRNEFSFSVSNSIDQQLYDTRIFEKGYSTKEGHSGYGLHEARKILAKYKGSTITHICTNDLFSMNVSVPFPNPGNHT